MTNKIFTKEHEKIILKYYPEFGSGKCQDFLPNFSKQQITSKANYLNLKYKYNKRSKIDLKEFTKMSNESIYILGFLWADGYVSKINNQIKLHIKTSDSEYLLSVLNKLGKWNIYNYPDKKSIEISIVDYNIHKWFCQYNFQQKSYIEPTKILDIIPKDKHFLFWLGYSDGDGSFYYSKVNYGNGKILRYELSAQYEYLHSEFTKYLELNSIFYKIRRRKNQKHGNNSLVLIQRKESLLKFGKLIYSSSLGMPRKRKIFESSLV